MHLEGTWCSEASHALDLRTCRGLEAMLPAETGPQKGPQFRRPATSSWVEASEHP